MTAKENSLQLARLWAALDEIKTSIDNTAIPLGSHLGLDDPELMAAMEELSARIGAHFESFRLVAERRRETN